ncbi:hypothetical protein ACRYCC_25595 [Actinomadura scrupuli]|uniref:SWIM zinc finger family protein n=1 Tax=Actinomadura scrupuli TaxID=559629 RepID=UPI003D977415
MTTWWSERFTARLACADLGVPAAADPGAALSTDPGSDPGEVSGLTIAAGSITAQVHGSRHEPYDVWIDLPVFTPAEWAVAERALADDTDCHDRILDGDLPPGLEDLFTRCGLSLLPAVRDLAMDCSCPDWAVPCAHVTAVLRVLAESFGTDPFGILTWRGRTRARLLQHLHALRTSTPEEPRRHAPAGSRSVPEPAPAEPRAMPVPVPAGAERPLAECLDDFWQEGAVEVHRPDASGHRLAEHALDRLGPPDLVIRGRDLAVLLLPAYQAFRAR